VNVLALPGLRSDPIQSYLAALGVLRGTAEQADPRAALAYHPSGFRLHTTLGLDELVDFFTDRWEPTPIVSPWNKDAGLLPDGSGKTARKVLVKLRDGSNPRLEPLRAAVRAAEAIVASFPEGTDFEKQKTELLHRCRASLPDRALDWFDASVVLLGDSREYSELLGTGGNFGRLDLSANLYGRIDDVIGLARPADRARSAGWVRDLLTGSSVTPRRRGRSPGQYEPGGLGGVNSVSDDRLQEKSVNPWAFVLALEGALLFASLPARRLGASSRAAAKPFTVRSDPAGSAGLAAGEARFAELWLPLWEEPATLPQLRRLFGEGRLAWGRAPATSSVDAARAIASFGTERGIAAFHRYAIVERHGQSPLAVPVERYATATARRPALESTHALDMWIRRLRMADHRPGAVEAALHRYDAALLELAAGERHGALATLSSLAELDETVGRNTSLRTDVDPLPWLDPTTWLRELGDEIGPGPELELAVAAASAWDRDVPDGPRKQPKAWPRSVSVALRGLANRSLEPRQPSRWSERSDARPTVGSPDAWLAEVHVRHALGSAFGLETDDAAAVELGARGRATTFSRGRWVTPTALRLLASGQLDEPLLRTLLRCLALLDPRGDWRAAPLPARIGEPPEDQAWLTLRYLLPQQGWQTLEAPGIADERQRAVRLLPSPGWPSLLRQGRIDRVLSDAWRRYRSAGLPVSQPPDPPTDLDIGDRLAAALLLPVSGTETASLLRQLLDPTRIPISDVRPQHAGPGVIHATT
jgi:CRISPR-associated protein Csx17